MPRWEGPPKYPYSPERLAYLREANRASRQRKRGGRPSMPHVEISRMGGLAAAKRQREKGEKRGLA
jgi:hypothetical protein